jgi:predicted nuclease of restriction endonuclease-like (RecB) superfamily
MIEKQANYETLLEKIGITYREAKSSAVLAINKALLTAYWHIGQYIVEFEQHGALKAEYGEQLLLKLSKDLTLRHGKGFSRSNLQYMRLFYTKYSICQMASGKLSWSYYVELVSISDDLARQFYEKQTLIENWSVQELKRQKKSALFHRLALSTDKEGVLQLAQKGKKIEQASDILKEPYILEFLNIPENQKYSESDLEQAIIDNLHHFLLELGKGFAFVGRQYRITLNHRHFFVDLVFYHIKLKRYVLIDLKLNEVEHYDIGQMNMYLGYFQKEMNDEIDNPPIGIILSQEKDDIMVEYAMMGISSHLFVSKYQLYLPEINDLKRQVKQILEK